MKKSKKIILIVFAAVAVLLIGYGIKAVPYYFFYNDYQKSLEALSYGFDTGKEFVTLDENDFAVTDMQLAAENEFLKLYTNPITTEIAVLDKRTGEITYSNPVDKGNDNIVSGVNKEELNSQLVIKFYNEKRYEVVYNNYKMSIMSGQFTTESIENGLRYTYTIGDLSNPMGIIPPFIKEERLKEKVLDKVSEADAKTVKSKYMASSKGDGILEITGATKSSPITISKLLKIFEAAGYTQEDYDYDMAMMEGIAEEPTSFTIPLEYRLVGDQLVVSIPTNQIVEQGKAKLASIQVLKFFGAANNETNGYLLVPNGSGSLINFNNNRTLADTYNQYIYDMDLAAADYIKLEKNQKARLPIFGIKRDETAIFAMIENGESFANISADIAGKINCYNYVFPTFTLRQTVLLSMFGSTGGEADLPVVEDKLYDTNLTVRYAFLEKEDADYSGMAKYYRNVLEENGTLKSLASSSSIPFYMDLVGGVQKKAFFLGAPYLQVYPMTTFAEAQKIAQKFIDDDIKNLRVNYQGWFNGGYYHDNAKNIGKLGDLGGKKELEKLTELVEAAGGKVFGDVAFQKLSVAASGYNQNFETSKYYSGIIVSLGLVNPAFVRQISSLGYKENLYNVMSPRYLNTYVNGFVKDFEKINLSGISLRDLGDSLNSDKKRSQFVNREEAKAIVKNAFETLKGTNKAIMVSGGDFYSLAYADDIINAPTTYNDYYIVDTKVPFYEMVIHGSINYSGSAINLSDFYDKNQIVLDLIETGAAPHFTFTYKETSEMKYTGLNYLYSTYYENWYNDAVDIYKEVNEALTPVSGSKMVKHEIVKIEVSEEELSQETELDLKEDLVHEIKKVTYDNGICIYLNPNDKELSVDGVKIASRSWKAVEVK